MYDLSSMYRKMYEIRKTEELIQELYDKGMVKTGTVHLCIGQEAVAVGVSSVLDKYDVVFSNHRGHGHMLARGLSPRKLIYEILGRDEGQCSGLGGSQHICAPEIGFMGSNGITGGAVPTAVGYALAKKLKGEPGISVVYFGDGAANQGAVHEAMNMASIWKLPVLFVYENNRYAMSSPAEKFFSGNMRQRAAGYGLFYGYVDGTRPWSVSDVAGVCRDACPSILECATYRLCGHSKSDRKLYVSQEEECLYKRNDILSNHSWWIPELLDDKVIDPLAALKRIEKEVDLEMDGVRKELDL